MKEASEIKIMLEETYNKKLLKHVITYKNGILSELVNKFNEDSVNYLSCNGYIKAYWNYADPNDCEYRWKCTKKCKEDYKLIYGKLSLIDIIWGLILGNFKL